MNASKQHTSQLANNQSNITALYNPPRQIIG